eukprot:4476610-Prymnesium_polylepis.3
MSSVYLPTAPGHQIETQRIKRPRLSLWRLHEGGTEPTQKMRARALAGHGACALLDVMPMMATC